MLSKIMAFLIGTAALAAAANRVPIIIPANAAAEESLAATELVHYLGRLYPDQGFVIEKTAPKKGPAIFVGARFGRKDDLNVPESFAVTRRGEVAIIAGADPRGTLYGVYALLEKLGCGFYLSYDALPIPRKGPIDLEAWQLTGAPLYTDRIVFDWHNFLSSASTWELEDWQRYIAQSSKMRFNTIMVHAYGNNPIFQFRYHGETKPIGYLATTARGRDWGTQHVNDVRRLIGGEIFQSPVFGSSIATAPDELRAAAATDLMKKVFAYARTRGMHITFALDVDTESANPQNIISTLPASALLSQGKLKLANPDTPEGYAYYKAQVQQLLAAYPQIDRLAVWFRAGRTPWMDLTPKDFPLEWRKEFEAAPFQGKEAAGIFAVSKLVRAYGRALHDLGRPDVQLATGSWRLEFVHAADLFMPPEAAIIPLDWSTVFDSEEGQAQVRGLTAGRRLIPIVWAHHDDRTYIGRSYTPYANFAELLKQSGSTGFGIIHWTTRPLDLYFKSMAAQVWSPTVNQPLQVACEEMAERSFGKLARTSGAEYLLKWVTEAPMFGRETSNRFLDHPLQDPEAIIAKCRERLDLLSRINQQTLPPEAKERLNYYRDYERFMLSFHESHSAFERAAALLKSGAVAEARDEIGKSDAEAVIRMYRQAAAHGTTSRGEQALLISLNLRWLPYIVSLRQALGLEPVRIKFGPTQHEPLAQSPGLNTFYVDEQKQLWKTLGEKETGAPVSESGIRLEKPFRFRLEPVAGDKLLPGQYAVELLFESTEPALIDLELGGVTKRMEVSRRISFRNASANGNLEITLRPVRGTASLAGAVLTSVGGPL